MGLPVWALVMIIGAVVWYLASATIGGLVLLIGLILLIVDLLGGVNLRQ